MEETRFEITIDPRASVGLAGLQATVQQAWADLQCDGSKARARALEAGIDVDALPAVPEELLELKPAAAGFGTTGIILLCLRPIAADLWKHVFLPQIRERWGDQAIKAKKALAKTPPKKNTKK